MNALAKLATFTQRALVTGLVGITAVGLFGISQAITNRMAIARSAKEERERTAAQ